MSFENFYQSMGLNQYPFSTFTTENETNNVKLLFSHPSNYSTLIQSFTQDNSILLVGERGIGKTAILLDFERQLNKNQALSVQIDDYTLLSQEYSSIDLYTFLIKRIAIKIFEELAIKKSRINNLNGEEKVLLSYLLKEYVPSYSKRLLKEKIEGIQISLYRRIISRIFNFFRPLLNYGVTVSSLLLEEFIAKHFKQLPPITQDLKIKEFFPEIPNTIDDDFENEVACYEFLNTVLKIVNKLGYKKVTIFMDKVDEDQRLDNNGEKIGHFMKNLLTDNNLLLNAKLQIVISLWQTPFNYIRDSVRTQKHSCPTLKWNNKDIENALNKRLSVFSSGKIQSYKNIFCSEFSDEDFSQIINLSNNNPRDLWHLMNKIFKVQFQDNPKSEKIEVAALQYAFEAFVKDFNYYEYYPKKLNARANSMDFYSYTAYLLKLDLPIFTKARLDRLAGVGGSINNYVVGMERIGLITKYSQEGGQVHYRIKDPKVVYALTKGFKIEK